jgi:primosomal protein N' (replication factor Y)
MPKVQIVDMRLEFQRGNKSIFSHLLLEKLSETLKKQEQAILLMNRRGFASHVFCRACGYVARCKNCSVSLVFHQSGIKGANAREDYARGHLACHHCGFSCGSIFECPACRSPFIRQMGMGTQRIETEVKEIFPAARVVRLDSDVTVRKGSHDEILQNFAHGNADVLIGTQMVAKGLDIANVTMIGVVAADSAFNMPDYRSTERGFQLLTQVSGRTGRGDKAGEVVWQTYNTEMPVLDWAKTHDFSLFAEEEIRARKAFNYPPFSQLIRVVVAGNVVTEVEQACDVLAEKIANFLADEYSEEAIQILGPAPCILERLRGKFRFHLLIKNFIGSAGHKAITGLLREQRMPEGIIMAVDVDALDLL